MTIKQQLKQIYQARINDFKQIVERFPDDDLAGPILMSPNGLYLNQPKRLMIIGQQTNGWTYHADDIDNQMKTYEDFNLGIDYYSSPFWNITRKIELALGNVEYSCVWTNINKFDLNANRPYTSIDFQDTSSKVITDKTFRKWFYRLNKTTIINKTRHTTRGIKHWGLSAICKLSPRWQGQ